MDHKTLEMSNNDTLECNICYLDAEDASQIITLKCCNNSKKICIKCIYCLTTPICPYCRKELDETCIPYLNHDNKTCHSEPIPNTSPLYSWDDFLAEEYIINPYLYEDSRRLRRQIRQLRYEYQQRISRTNSNRNSLRERRDFHRRRRRDLNQFTRNIQNDYNDNHQLSYDYDMLFDMDA